MYTLLTNTSIDKKLYKIKEFKKGEIVFNAFDKCSSIGYVLKGLLSIKTFTFENEYEIRELSDNEIFGGNLIFSSSPFYLGTCIALKKTKILFFTKDNLLSAFKDNNFLINFLKIQSDETLKVQKKVKILSQGTIKDKILFILYSNYLENNTYIYKIKSKQSLANYLNVTRPSLSRELIKLKNENIIEYNKSSITLKKVNDII